MTSEPLREAVALLEQLEHPSRRNEPRQALLDRAARVIRALISSGQSESGGEWVLVPKEPTHEMCKVGYLAPINGIGVGRAADVYRAMIAAAPDAPSLPTGGG